MPPGSLLVPSPPLSAAANVVAPRSPPVLAPPPFVMPAAGPCDGVWPGSRPAIVSSCSELLPGLRGHESASDSALDTRRKTARLHGNLSA